MTIKQHIQTTLDKMLSVKVNTYYTSLLFGIINEVSGEKISLDDLVITSVAEHCTFPNSYNTVSNILTIGKGFASYPTNKRKYFIVLSGSLVPLDNADYPRGFFYNRTLSEIDKIPLWENKVRKSFPLIQPNVAEDRVPLKKFNYNQSKYIDLICDFLQKNPMPYYQQICQINTKLYNELVIEDEYSPKIIFLSLEDIALKFLNLLIEKEDIIIENFIFNNYTKTYNYLFDVPTCWNNDKGSFLFWYEQDKKLFPLKFQENYFSNDLIKINLVKEEIVMLLKLNKLYPSVFVSLLLTNIITNLPTLGGKRQGIYLKKMIDYFNEYDIQKTSHEINNVNWGIHPNIAKYLNEELKEISGIYLISNPPTQQQYEAYISNENIIC
jgi:hypothetical protein